MSHIRKYLAAFALAFAALTVAAPAVAHAAPVPVAQPAVSTAPAVAFTSGEQCVGGWLQSQGQCGQVVGTGLHINYLNYLAYHKIGAGNWCGFIEAVEQTQNGSWSAVQYSRQFCGELVTGGFQGSLGVNLTMPLAGELYEYAIPAYGYANMGINVFYIN